MSASQAKLATHLNAVCIILAREFVPGRGCLQPGCGVHLCTSSCCKTDAVCSNAHRDGQQHALHRGGDGWHVSIGSTRRRKMARGRRGLQHYCYLATGVQFAHNDPHVTDALCVV